MTNVTCICSIKVSFRSTPCDKSIEGAFIEKKKGEGICSFNLLHVYDSFLSVASTRAFS